MICVYPADCKDFSNNGLGIVLPQSCTVTETLNGEWELTLIHPIDVDEHGSCHVLPKQPCKCPYFGTRLKNQRRKGL